MEKKKCVIVGDSRIGKTCLVSTYIERTFSSSNLGVFSIEAKSPNGIQFELDIVDTKGDDNDIIRPLSYAVTDVLLICFSLISPPSLKNVETKWCPEVKNLSPNTPIILVGTHSDLLRNEDERKAKKLKGEEMAKKIGAESYFECSASRRIGLDEVFNEVLEIVSRSLKKAKPRPSQKNAKPRPSQKNAEPRPSQKIAEPHPSPKNAEPSSPPNNPAPRRSQKNAEPHPSPKNAKPSPSPKNAEPSSPPNNPAPLRSQKNAEPRPSPKNAKPSPPPNNPAPRRSQKKAEPHPSPDNASSSKKMKK